MATTRFSSQLLALVSPDDKHREVYIEALDRFESHLEDRAGPHDFNRWEVRPFLSRLRDCCTYREFRLCRRAILHLWQRGFDEGILEQPPSVD